MNWEQGLVNSSAMLINLRTRALDAEGQEVVSHLCRHCELKLLQPRIDWHLPEAFGISRAPTARLESALIAELWIP